jgi:cytochrome c-type biogenesis protein CcmH
VIARALLLSFALFAGAAFAIDPLGFKDREEELRFQALARELRCLVCQNQTLADSDADLAKDLRHEIFELMHAGKSDAEIKQFLQDRYGDFVLYNPPVKSNTYVLWFGPFLVLALGAGALVAIVRRRARALPSELPPAEENDR